MPPSQDQGDDNAGSAPGNGGSTAPQWVLLFWNIAVIVGLVLFIKEQWIDVFDGCVPLRAMNADSTARAPLPPADFRRGDLVAGGDSLIRVLRADSADTVVRYLAVSARIPKLQGLLRADSITDAARAALLADINGVWLGDTVLVTMVTPPADTSGGRRWINRRIVEKLFAKEIVPRKEGPRADSVRVTAQEKNDGACELSVLLLVLAFGALGAAIQSASAFSAFTGIGRFDRRWIVWYVLRPFVGMGLAGIFYCVVRGGLLAQNMGPGSLNIFAVVGLAGLVGLFSKVAMQKLQTAFGGTSAPDPERAARGPRIDTIVPETLTPGGVTSVVVKGKNFSPDCYLEVDGVKQVRSSVTSTQMEARVDATTMTSGTKVKAVVVDPGSGGDVRSNSHSLTIA